MASWRKAIREYKASGGHAFNLFGNGAHLVGVREGNVYGLSNNREIVDFGPLNGSHAELTHGRRGFPFALVTFADGVSLYSDDLLGHMAGVVAKEIAAYNRLSGYVAPPTGLVGASPRSQAQPGMAWTCRFCKTVNRDEPTCDHCGAPRPAAG